MTHSTHRRAAFLDRDGTLIEDPGYLSDPTQVKLLPGTAAALNALAAVDVLRVVITNQSGVGRGIVRRSGLHRIMREMKRQLKEAGTEVDMILVCPHLPDVGCLCRKPGTALHRQAAAVLDIDLAASWYIGDQLRDLQPAIELGGRALLVRTGHGAEHEAAALAMGADVAVDLADGVKILSRYL